MNKTIFWSGMFVMILIFGVAFSGCGNDPKIVYANDLNGTWTGIGKGYAYSSGDGYWDSAKEEWVFPAPTREEFDISVELRFDNGNFQISMENPPFIDNTGFYPFIKGTYTTSGSTITIVTTHVWGITYDEDLESRWYTNNELKSALALNGYDRLEEIDATFLPTTLSFSLSGNNLIMSGNDLEIMTLTRQ